MPVLIRLFAAGRKDIRAARSREATRPPRSLAEAFRENAPARVRRRRATLRQPTHSNHGTAHISLHATARPAQSSEPILVPKLRISFADFPYLHFSNDQRLFTLETCCGYRVRPSTKITLTHSDFQGPTKALWTPQEPRCFTEAASLSPGKPISGTRFLTKKRQLSPGLWPTSPSSFALPLSTPKRLSPCLGSGILT